MKNSLLALVIGLVMSACTSGQAPTTAAVELKRFPLDSLEGVRATTGASFDPKTSGDGKGSLRVDAKERSRCHSLRSPTSASKMRP
jgi:hypothetical protein